MNKWCKGVETLNLYITKWTVPLTLLPGILWEKDKCWKPGLRMIQHRDIPSFEQEFGIFSNFASKERSCRDKGSKWPQTAHWRCIGAWNTVWKQVNIYEWEGPILSLLALKFSSLTFIVKIVHLVLRWQKDSQKFNEVTWRSFQQCIWCYGWDMDLKIKHQNTTYDIWFLKGFL